MKLLIAGIVITLFIHLPTSGFAQEKPHPLFLPLTEERVRTTFAEYEAKGKRGEKVKFGLERPVEFPVEVARGVEVLKFKVAFMPLISQVRKSGYEFGKLGRSRTAADREAVLKRLIERMKNSSEVIPFNTTLESRSDWSTSVKVTFALVNEKAITILPHQQPNFDCPERDILCHVAMAENGVPITFALFADTPGVPFVTDKMKLLKLIVEMGDRKVELVFELNSIS